MENLIRDLRHGVRMLRKSRGLRTTLVGVAVGIAGALALARTLQSLLFGLSANDPLSLALASLLFMLGALLACYIPARRAAGVDPIVALRYE